MSEPEDLPPKGDRLLEEAAAWFARMRGPDAEASRAGFEAWLRRGALHRAAYNRASEIFAMGKLLADEEESAATTASLPAASRATGARGRLLLAVLGAFTILVGAGWLALQGAGSGTRDRIAEQRAARPAGPLSLATAAGEVRVVRLADGSLVRLEGGTALDMVMGPSERRLTLQRGRVRIEVFHEARPFVVEAGGGRVVARGTVFEVGLSADRQVTVRLISGAVDVTLPVPRRAAGAAPVMRRLRPGDAVTYAAGPDRQAGTTPPTVTAGTAAPSAAMAPLDHDAVAVGTLIAEANRGSERPIRLAVPAIAERRVSGHFRIDDTRLLAERLALLFGLTADLERPEEIVLKSR